MNTKTIVNKTVSPEFIEALAEFTEPGNQPLDRAFAADLLAAHAASVNDSGALLRFTEISRDSWRELAKNNDSQTASVAMRDYFELTYNAAGTSLVDKAACAEAQAELYDMTGADFDKAMQWWRNAARLYKAVLAAQ